MKKIEMLKTAGGLIVSVGVGNILSNAIKATTPFGVGKIEVITIKVGAFVLGSMITDKAIHYTEQKVDEIIKQVKNMANNGDLD